MAEVKNRSIQQLDVVFFGVSVASGGRLADDIAHASDGWLTARSLRDPAVQTLLNAARPGWRYGPYDAGECMTRASGAGARHLTDPPHIHAQPHRQRDGMDG